MAFSFTVNHKTVIGNWVIAMVTLTDVQAAGSAFNPGVGQILGALGQNITDIGDVMQMTWSGETLTATCGDNDDDGDCIVFGTIN